MSTSDLVNRMNQFRPVLKRIVPNSVLRWSKQQVIKQITRKIGNENVLPYQKDAFPYGLNLIGPVDSATGLGQSFRLIERVVRETDVPYLIYNCAQNTKNKIELNEYSDMISAQLKYSVNLWHINLSEFAQTYAMMGKQSFDCHYNIAFWLWELEEFPDEWVPYINLLDEIWTPSEFISNSIRKKTDKPVHTIPYYVTAKADTEAYGRGYFSLPKDKFLFLMMYDSLSVKERKNPEGVIQAYRKAFPSERDDVGLVIKINSADDHEINYLKKMLKGYKNVYFICQNLAKVQVNSLVACVDTFVSLHRAEGFGLVMAEAMLNHTPVIATNWSANTEFMNPEVACMVGYKMLTLENDILPYRRGMQWADANIEEAADFMKRLVSDNEFKIVLIDKAYKYIIEKLGLKNAEILIKNRLYNIIHNDEFL